MVKRQFTYAVIEACLFYVQKAFIWIIKYNEFICNIDTLDT
jgi:hypothetical protein